MKIIHACDDDNKCKCPGQTCSTTPDFTYGSCVGGSGPPPSTTCDPNNPSDCIKPDKCMKIPGYDDKLHCYSTGSNSLGCQLLAECNENQQCCIEKCPANSPTCPNDCTYGGCNTPPVKENYTSFYGYSRSDKTAGIVAFIGLLIALYILHLHKKK